VLLTHSFLNGELVSMQHQDEFLATLMAFLSDPVYELALAGSHDLRSMYATKKHLTLVGGIMIAHAHDEPCGGHRGVKATCETL
jgi:hypothetical protein